MEKKIIDLYKKKFELNRNSFDNFLNEKSKLDSFEIDLIKLKIKEFEIGQTFNEDTLRILIKLMTAVQLHGELVRHMNRNSINQIEGNFDFKGKKKAQQLASETKVETKAHKIQPQTQKQQSDPKIQIKKQEREPVELEYHMQPIMQSVKSQQQKPQRKQPKEPKPLSIIGQVQNSTEINLTPRNQSTGPKFLDLTESRDLTYRAKIISYEKFSEGYVNPVIKYKIQYQKKRVLRRFSDFEKLLNILKLEYQGCILPKLPPKQGIKGGINYFWGIDEVFLEERRKKLEQMLNRLIDNKFVNQDKTLHKFLTIPEFQIEQNNEGYGAYIKSLADMALNPKQVKDYGVAYWSYLTGSKEKAAEIKPTLLKKYAQIQDLVQVFFKLNSYRKRINTNFDKRRGLMHEIGIKSRFPQNTKFDKMMDCIEEEIEDLNYEISNYKSLKEQESWIHELIRQKQSDGPKVLHDLNQDKQKVENRLKKIETNLALSLDEFQLNKITQLKETSEGIVQWRYNAHP